jgi:hypothetical protein
MSGKNVQESNDHHQRQRMNSQSKNSLLRMVEEASSQNLVIQLPVINLFEPHHTNKIDPVDKIRVICHLDLADHLYLCRIHNSTPMDKAFQA